MIIYVNKVANIALDIISLTSLVASLTALFSSWAFAALADRLNDDVVVLQSLNIAGCVFVFLVPMEIVHHRWLFFCRWWLWRQ